MQTAIVGLSDRRGPESVTRFADVVARLNLYRASPELPRSHDRRLPVDLNDTPELAEHRAPARAWLDDHKAEAPTRRDVTARREWQRKLAEGGLAAVTWPADYGGQGLGPLTRPRQRGDRPRGRAGISPSSASACRPDADRARQRGAEAAPPWHDAYRRGGLVRAVLRARGGLRPRGHGEAQAQEEDGSWRLRARRCGGGRPVRLVGAAARAHRRRASPSTRA